MKLKWRNIDKIIWKEELEDFLPERIFDFHNHVFSPAGFHDSLPKELEIYLPSNLNSLRERNEILFPKRRIKYLLTGWPGPSSDLEKQNEFVFRQMKTVQKEVLGLMTVSPDMKLDYLIKEIKDKGFIGFKPYKCFSLAKDPEDSRIEDFLPKGQLEVANQYRLIITLHLSKKKGISESQNLDDLERLSSDYPNVIWNLAHCGRAFIPQNLEPALLRLKTLKHRKICYDTAAVTDSEVFYLLLAEIGFERVLYGSDNPVGFQRGKCVGLGYDWAFITEDKFSLKESFGKVEPTFLLYEELRALKRAAKRVNLSKKEIENVFYRNAERILSLNRR